MYSDNGTNVREADNELRSLVVQLDNEKVEETIANKVVVWNFYRPLHPSPFATHFVGVYETMIKSMK